MSSLAIAVVILSSCLHAGWNLLSRRGHGEAGYFRRVLTVIVVVGLVPAAVAEARLGRLSPVVLAFGAVSGVCCGLYYLFLCQSYKSADFTVAYPTARALPVILVAGADLARGRSPSLAGWGGLLLVLAGCVLIPHRRLHDLNWHWFRTRAAAMIALTALCTTGYTVLDKLAADRLQRGLASALLYGYVLFVMTWVVYGLAARTAQVGRSESVTPPWWQAVLGAVMDFGAYGLVLWAYQLSRQASYVLAFRQLSIVIGVLAGAVLYREPGLRLRGAAALLITAGLIVVGVFG